MPDDLFYRNFQELSDTLDLKPLLSMPVRKLSLGQRMRCDLAAALLHSPAILYLDEPTIGLDLIAKDQVRKFLKKVNKDRGATIILTTHDMDDIEALCDRIIILDEGKIAYDGSTDTLKREYVREKLLEIEFHEDDGMAFDLPMVNVIKSEANKKWFSFDQDKVSVQEVISRLLAAHDVKDISIHEPKVADIVKNIYANGIKRMPQPMEPTQTF